MRPARVRIHLIESVIAVVAVACSSPTAAPTSSTTSTTTTSTTTTVVNRPAAPAELMGGGAGLGRDPEATAPSRWWINVAGPASSRLSGDRYQSKTCFTQEFQCTSATPGVPNDAYEPDGYFIAVDVRGPVTGPLRIEGYDLAMTSTGDGCSQAMPTASQRAALAQWYPDATSRFGNEANTWCTGDDDLLGRTAATSLVVREPDATPSVDTDNPVVSGTPTCVPVRIPAFVPGAGGAANPSIFNWLHPSDGVADSQAVRNPDDLQLTFAELFHRWAPVCEIPADQVVPGRYLVQVRTNSAVDDPTIYDPTVATGGGNRFSLRASMVSGPPGSVSMAAVRRISTRSVGDVAASVIPLVRVPRGAAGQTVHLELFDLGDAAIAGTLMVLAPEGSSTALTGCTFVRDDGASLSMGATPCSLANVQSSTYNSRVVTAEVPIPPDYTCDEADPSACWIRLRAAFPGGWSDTFSVEATLPPGT